MAKKSSEKQKTLFYVTGYFAFAVGILLFGLLCGMIVHEESHAIVCLAFGFSLNYFSLTEVVYSYQSTANNFSVLMVLLAGGIGQALFSLLLLWAFVKIERGLIFTSKKSRNYSAKLGLIFGSEVSLLSIAIHGIINAIWEGILYQNYLQYHDDQTLGALLILLCSASSFIFLMKRFGHHQLRPHPQQLCRDCI